MLSLTTILDIAVVAIGLVAIYRGYRNGLVNQIIWFISFAAGYVVASRFAGVVATVLDNVIPSETVAVGVSFVILALATIIILHLIGDRITDALKLSVVGKVNSILGAVLNLLVFLLGVLVLLNIAVLIIPKADEWIRSTYVLERLTALNHLIGDERITRGLENAISKLP